MTQKKNSNGKKKNGNGGGKGKKLSYGNCAKMAVDDIAPIVKSVLPFLMGDDTSFNEGRSRVGGAIQTPMPRAYSYSVPHMNARSRTDQKSSVVEHQELVGSVLGSIAFASTKYSVNPGLGLTPWLAARARGFNKYRYEYLEYFYVPEGATTSDPGTIFLSFAYDPSQAAPSSLALMSNHDTQDSTNIWKGCSVVASARRGFDGVQTKRVRHGPVGDSLTVYDPSSFYVSTTGCSGAAAIGNLWCRYKVRFVSPNLENANMVPCQAAQFSYTGPLALTTGVLDYVPWNTVSWNRIEGMSILGDNIIMPEGVYIVTSYCSFKDTSAENLDTITHAASNGAPIAFSFNYQYAAVPANGERTQSNTCIFVSPEGGSNFNLGLLATGAAGTLTLETATVFMHVIC